MTASRISFANFPRDYESSNSPWYRFYRCLQHLERKLPESISPTSSWLDVGCHSGSFLRAVGEVYGITDLHGCDQYPEEHKSQKVYECFKLSQNDHWIYHQVNLANDVNFSRQFDVISALEVIEHMDDTDKFLSDMYNCLSENGTLIITTPNINNLRNRVRVPFGAYPIGLEYRDIIHHVRLYNVHALNSHLTEHSFRILSLAAIQLLPERLIARNRLLRSISERLSDSLPQFGPNVLVIAKKVGKKGSTRA